MYADIIIKNGRCVTMCGDGGADWVAAAGKMICAAGRGDDWQKLVRPGTQVIDARGGTVLPGFIDNHFHVMQTAVNMMSVDLGGARSHRELGEMLAAAEKREGAVLGCQVEESQFEEKRFPDRYVLDRYCSDSPVVLFSKEYHVSMLNTHALLYYKVPFSLEGVELDSSGLPTGIFRRNANYVLRSNVLRSLPDEFRMEAIHLAMSRLLENGITTGTGDTQFSPDQPCTRVQVVLFLWRAAGSPAPEQAAHFADVPDDAYYAQAVAWAVETGITSGTGEAAFSPDRPCTRGEIVTFLHRALVK